MKKRYLNTIICAVILLVIGISQARDVSKKTTTIPDFAKNVVSALFPSAKIEKVEAEPESIKVFEVDLTQPGKACSVNVTAEGRVLSLETEETENSIPAAVAKTIKQTAGKSKIEIIEKEEIREEIKIVKLPEPMIIYEAKYIKDGKIHEVKIDINGKVLGVQIAEDEDEDGQYNREEDDDDDDEDADDEGEEISIKEVPDSVRNIITKESSNGKIKEIERKNIDGKIIYEVEIEKNNTTYDLKISKKGKLLEKIIDEDDDDNEYNSDDDNDDGDDDEEDDD